MPRLGRYQTTIIDTTGAPVSGATVDLYKEGAVVNMQQALTAPSDTITVHDRGHIDAISGEEDVVFITNPGSTPDETTTYTVTAVTATSITISFGADFTVEDGARIVATTNRPVTYTDDAGTNQTATQGQVTTGASGYAQCWVDSDAYDVLVKHANITNRLLISQPVVLHDPLTTNLDLNNYRFENTLWLTNQSTPTIYNNGFTGLYARYTVDADELEEMTLGGGSVAGNASCAVFTLNVTHDGTGTFTGARTNDEFCIGTNLQLTPTAGGNNFTAPVNMFLQTYNLGAGDITTATGVSHRVAINAGGDFVNVVHYQATGATKGASGSGTITTKHIGFEVKKLYIDEVSPTTPTLGPPILSGSDTSGLSGLSSQHRIYVADDFGDGTWVGTRIGSAEAQPANDCTRRWLGNVHSAMFIHGENTQQPFAVSAQITWPDTAQDSYDANSNAHGYLCQFNPYFDHSVPDTVGGAFFGGYYDWGGNSATKTSANTTINEIDMIRMVWGGTAANEAGTYTTLYNINMTMPSPGGSGGAATNTITTRYGLKIAEVTKPAAATWTTTRMLDIDAPDTGAATFAQLTMRAISTSAPKTGVTDNIAVPVAGDWIFIVDTDDTDTGADNSGPAFYDGNNWIHITRGGVAVITDA